MNMQNKLSTLVAIALATTATSGFAITDDDEDSVRSWGPWATLVQPAAGPQTPTPTNLAGPVVPGFGSGDASPFTPTVITPTTPTVEPTTQGRCVAGSLCGYAFISQGIGFDSRTRTSPQTATPTLTPIPENVQVVPVMPAPGGFPGFLPIVAPTVNTSLTVNSDTDLVISQELLNRSVSFRGNTWSHFFMTLTSFGSLSGTTIDANGTPFAYGFSSEIDFGSFDPFAEEENTATSINTAFLYGESTGLDDLNTLNAGNITASYEGFTLNSKTPVAINVDFGGGTWNGSWNGGTDSSSFTNLSSDNVNVLSGSIGFEASGTISGANIVSTSVSATDASAISGTVNGSFFGGEAGVLAGAVDVTKTTEAYTDGVYRDLYVTGTEGVKIPNEIIRRDN